MAGHKAKVRCAVGIRLAEAGGTFLVRCIPRWAVAALSTVGRECVPSAAFTGSLEFVGLLSGRGQRLTGAAGPGRDGAESKVESLKVPHGGWNSLHLTRKSWLLDGLDEGDQVYFTHSFAAPVTTDCVGSTRYGIEFAAAVERDRVAGVQFHPEKSSDVGLRILGNFLRLVAE